MIIPWLKTAFRFWKEDHASFLAAALSYYITLSLAPLLVVVTAIVGLIYQDPNSRLQLFRVLQDILGADLSNIFSENLGRGTSHSGGPIALMFGAGLTIIGSLGAFKQLERGLNLIWHVKSPKRSLQAFLEHYLSLFLLILVGSAFLIITMAVSTFLNASGGFLSEASDFVQILVRLMNTVISFGLSGLLFAVLLKEIPDVPLRFRQVLPAAFITAFLFSMGKFAMGFYLVHSSTTSVYGAAGSLAALLIWLFYASQIFFFGAELIKADCPQLLPVAESTASKRVPAKTPSSPLASTASLIALYLFFKNIRRK